MMTADLKLKETYSLEEKLSRQHIKKQKHYFENKDLSSPSHGFPVVTHRCESWPTRKAERQRTDAFEHGEDS